MQDIDTRFITQEFLPQIIALEALTSDKRSLKEELAVIPLYDLSHNCPTNAAIILLGKNPQFFIHCCYV